MRINSATITATNKLRLPVRVTFDRAFFLFFSLPALIYTRRINNCRTIYRSVRVGPRKLVLVMKISAKCMGQNGADRSITRGWYCISFHPRNIIERLIDFYKIVRSRIKLNIFEIRRDQRYSKKIELFRYNEEMKEILFHREKCFDCKSINRRDYKIRVMLNVMPSTRFCTIHFFMKRFFEA